MAVRYLSRHELTSKELLVMKKWQKSLTNITRPGGLSRKYKLEISDTRHFEVELRRVNKFIKNYPK